MSNVISFEDGHNKVATCSSPDGITIAVVDKNNIGSNIKISKESAYQLAMNLLLLSEGELPADAVVKIPGAFHDASPTYVTLTEYGGNDLLHIEQEEQSHNNRVILAYSEIEQLIPALVQALDKMQPETDRANTQNA